MPSRLLATLSSCAAKIDADIIVLCVRWYSPNKVSCGILKEMMVEQALNLAHTTVV